MQPSKIIPKATLPWPFWKPLGYTDAPKHYRDIAEAAGITESQIRSSAAELWKNVRKDAKTAYANPKSDLWAKRYEEFEFLRDRREMLKRLFPGLGMATVAFAGYYFFLHEKKQ